MRDEAVREKWTNKFDFLFITAGSAIGLGNVWRFPYLCYKNGGGAFMIPYLVTLFVIALPQLILQTSLGQLTSRSPTRAWNIVPLMKGIGYSSTYCGYIANLTYATILAWSLRYFYESFSSVSPWMTCNNHWNTENCFVSYVNGSNFANISSSTLKNATLINGTAITNISASSSVNEFWMRSVLNISSGLTEVGSIQTEVLVCLLVTWAITYLCMIRGVTWTSKVTYVTATLPIILLMAILIRGLTLDGAIDGIKYFLDPNVEFLLRPQVWKDAVLQNLFSLSLSSGSMVAFGSFNKKHHNFYRDCFTLSFVNAGASIVSGFAVFSTLGFMAKQQNTTVKAVAAAGPGLVFTVYPEAMAMMPLPQFWSAIFFLMLFLLGLDSLFTTVEAIVIAIADHAHVFFNKRWKKSLLNLAISLSMLLLGIPTVTQNGMYYIYLLDNFGSSGWGVLFGIACECITISWLFGVNEYYEEICKMLRFRPRFPWFKYCWKFFTPIISLVLFGYCLALYKPLVYDKVYVYPKWSLAIGWIISLAGFLWIPGYAIHYLVKRKSRKEHIFGESGMKDDEFIAMANDLSSD